MDLPVAPYDILMIAVLLFCAIIGAWKGMAWQLAALGSLVVSGILAARFGGQLAPYFGEEEPWNRCLAMLVIYLVTSAAIWLLFRWVAGIIDRVKLKEFDRQVGALFGIAKGVLWCLVITLFTVTLSERARQWVLGSHSGYYASLILQRATPVLPAKVRDALGGYIEEFERKLDPNEPSDAPVVQSAAVWPESRGEGAATVSAEARKAPTSDAGKARKPLVLPRFPPRYDRT